MNRSPSAEEGHSKIRAVTSRSQLSVESGSTPDMSSSYVSSNYARYLWHLQLQEEELTEQKELYWHVTTKCLLYLKRQREGLNTDWHDELMGHTLGHNFNMTRIDPAPRNELGLRLIENGYVLAAYAVLMSRIRNSSMILKYYIRLFSDFTITVGKTQMLEYLNREEQCGYETESTKQRGDGVVLRSRLNCECYQK